MKFLIHGNSPVAGTGYGVQIRNLARRLKADGHDVAVSCTFGQQAQGRTWEGIQLYPSGYESNSMDALPHHAMHFFEGDPLGGWIITLLDVWAMANPRFPLKEFNVAAWTPVDHLPTPPGVMGFFDNHGAHPVAMSRFGEEQLRKSGLDPTFIPLSVDTSAFKPTSTLEINGRTTTGREMLGVPEDAFLVGMAAMNKDPFDRKGFNEALRAFGAFHRKHPEAVLYLHTSHGTGGINLNALATHAAIPVHAIKLTDWYANLHGFSDEQMAAMYTAFDVLLAPSRGEGFCVPLIEAQACGTPVIASDFSAQPELVGSGYTVHGQLLWDDTQQASWIIASIPGVVDALEQAYTLDRDQAGKVAQHFAREYDADTIYDRYWRPFIHTLGPTETYEADPIPTGPDSVAVVVPAMKRPHNVAPLVESFTSPDVNVYFVCDPDDTDQIAAVKEAGATVIESTGTSFAVKANDGYRATTEPWIFLCGDDVRATPGWLDEARSVSHLADVVGTNDSTDGEGNWTVQNGTHSDHSLIRRSYIDMPGASLDGPQTLCAEVYGHYFVDWELVRLAKARGRFKPCLAAVVEHLHPGLDKAPSDLIYARGMSHMDADRETWEARAPMIEMQRVGIGK